MNRKSGAAARSLSAQSFTEKQGHYLTFIYTYSHMFRRPPAETDMQRRFQVSPPSVHQMIVTLERNGSHLPSTWRRTKHPNPRCSGKLAHSRLAKNQPVISHVRPDRRRARPPARLANFFTLLVIDFGMLVFVLVSARFQKKKYFIFK
jgi:hypothetical protein